jgi:hypothetical protein
MAISGIQQEKKGDRKVRSKTEYNRSMSVSGGFVYHPNPIQQRGIRSDILEGELRQKV